jgi:membrane protease YdiL (CAAX protease family)
LSFSQIKNYPLWLRLGLFLLTLASLWAPFVLLVYFLIGTKDANLTTIVTMGILFILFLCLLPVWGKKIYANPNIFKTYGLVNSSQNFHYWGKGLMIGFSLAWLLFIVEAMLGWVSFQTPSISLPILILEGFISSLGIALAEELFFRGWLLDEIERDFSAFNSNVISSLIFACLHFIKPIAEIIRTSVTFPALALLGYILVVAKRSHKNLLGICIGLHGGLVWAYYIINVGEIIEYHERVPSWITGIDNNPIAGVMGLIFLSALLYFLAKFKPN